MIGRWTWLLGLRLFFPDDCRTNASHYRNKSKSLSEQIQVIIGWMSKLLGRGQPHHAISRLLGKGTFAIGNQDMGASSNWFLHLDNYALSRILSLSAFLFQENSVWLNTIYLAMIDCLCMQFDVWARSYFENSCAILDLLLRIKIMHQCSAEQSQCWIFHEGLIQVCFLSPIKSSEEPCSFKLIAEDYLSR